ncbi:hypothetical protein HBO08_23675 [Pseudomonas rhodesiae]|uniref:hypothetical protein n=1 Tax=Pseudomonas rhodesiae TaxID=76760 RepID=UPI00147618C7|nr:hypothetical protein [Pseudomonas rhodesiae]NMZ20021.1 hypothetical protein [Pseudomonas rhodesiae]
MRQYRRAYDLEVNVALILNNLTLSRHNTPPTAQLHLGDADGCAVIVNVKLEGKPVDEFSLKEITKLGLEAAKHLTHQV